jgi:hypothetical protein
LVTVDLGAALKKYRENSTDFQNVVVELVNESQVRAKSGFTRIFIPLTSEVLDFYHNLGKWFLHFSEPEMLKRTILPKSNRNIGDHRQTAVIYRRGVRVREITRIDTPSLYDYNLENLKMDESRQVDDHVVQHEAAVALSKSDVETLSRLFQSFMNNEKFWEHSFSEYSLSEYCNDSHYKKNWLEAFDKVADKNSVFSTEEGGKVAARKGYNVICAPYTFVRAAERYDLKTPSKVLSLDDHLGREIVETHYNSLVALNFAWDLCERHKLTNGKNKPIVKNFRKIMDGGTQDLGFYRNDEVYLNEDIVGSSHIEHWSELNQQLLVTCLEEVSHHVTGSTDFSRDFQDFLLNLLVYVAKEK